MSGCLLGAVISCPSGLVRMRHLGSSIHHLLPTWQASSCLMPPATTRPRPDPSHLWASTTETTPAPKGCQGRKELLPCAPEHRLEGRDDTGTPLGLLGEKGPPGAMSGDTYQARWCLNGALINGRIWTDRDGGCTAKAGIRKPGVGGWAEAESDTLWLWVSSQRKLYTSSGGILPSTW